MGGGVFVAGGSTFVWTWFATAWTYAILVVPILLLPSALDRRDAVMRAATYVNGDATTRAAVAANGPRSTSSAESPVLERSLGRALG